NVLIGLCTEPSRYEGDALINWRVVEAMNLPRVPWQQAFRQLPNPHLIVDAIFGTGLSKTPRPPFPQIVQKVADAHSHVLAVDLPSGLDCDTGKPLGPCIRANRTITLAAQKVGFRMATARRFTGSVTVADIGCPWELLVKVESM
ncbi:MAG TPA: NAD(P)H-hydrate epimerase, partial [Tepidisphaeraceae bacterium]|nr:NAD(P)H-hydrate epimerase [Tepidisphaeraceae bacterium]